MKRFQPIRGLAVAACSFLLVAQISAQDSTIKFFNLGNGTTKYQVTNSQSLNGGLQFGIDGTNDAFISQTEGRPLLLRTGGQERMRITSAGNIGIGTATPLTQFHLVGMSRFGGRIMVDDGDGLYFENPTQSLILRTIPGNLVINAQQGSLDFGTKDITKIRITGSGNEIRMVNAGTSMGSNFGLQAISSSDTLIPFGIKAYAGQKVPLMVVQNGGEGRIYTIDFDGNTAIKRSVLKNYALTVGGEMIAHTYNTFADQRMEQQVTSLPNVMQNLRKIHGFSFNFKGAPFDKYLFPARPQFGLQAQEVMTIYPELVTLNTDSFYSINYQGFIPVLIEGIKEMDSVQQKLIAQEQQQEMKYVELTKEIKQLKALVDSLKELIEDRVGIMAPGDDEVDKAALFQNHPNPFSSATTIKYFLPYSVKTANLYIFDMNGKQLMKIAVNQRGKGAEVILGNTLKAGMYIYSLVADNKEVANRRMILTK